jgi:hypothetical protein
MNGGMTHAQEEVTELRRAEKGNSETVGTCETAADHSPKAEQDENISIVVQMIFSPALVYR